MKAMKFGKTIIALAVAGLQAQAETLKVQYAKEDRSFHTLLVEENVEFLDFEGSGLTSLTLPAGLSNLKELNLIGNRLTGLVLPEGLSSLKTLDLSFNPLTNLTLPAGLSNLKELNLIGNRLTGLVLPEGLSSLKKLLLGAEGSPSRVSVGFRYAPDGNPSHICLGWNSMLGVKYQIQGQVLETGPWDGIKEVIAVSTQTEECLPLSDLSASYQRFRAVGRMIHLQVPWVINTYDWEIIFDGGRWKPFEEIPPSAPFSIEYYRTQFLSMRRLEDGIEIVWDEGTLQSAPTVNGPWKDVASGGTVRRLFRSSPFSEFFRVKP